MRLQHAPVYRHTDGAWGFLLDWRLVRPLVIMNPRSDARFVELVTRLMEDAPTGTSDLQDGLRAQYPEALVRRRELSSESTEVWYVYRDGHWTPD